MISTKTKKLYVRNLPIGGGAPVSVQSMVNVPAFDTPRIIDQIHALAAAGCELIRVAVPNHEASIRLGKIVESSLIPVCADIHFDWRLAMDSLAQGVDKLRLNPGNLQKKDRLKEITSLALERKVPIRIGVNSGSLDKKLLKKYGSVTAEALFESAVNEVEAFEKLGFFDIVISVKTFSIPTLLRVNRMLSEKFEYPLHLGVTEAGTILPGTVRSAVGISNLLAQGIGDTIRVSLTADPINEVKAGWEILKALDLRQRGATVISCPGCGRTGIDIYTLADRVNAELSNCDKNITVAVMGCVVNGPGEARNADVGCAGGKGEGIIFKKGEIVKKVAEEDLFPALINEINMLINDKEN